MRVRVGVALTLTVTLSSSNSSWHSARAGTAGASGPLAAGDASAFSGPLFTLCGVCWFFAQALIGEFEAAGRTPPQLGLVCAALS